jgi:hypothetical protein
MKTHIIPCRGGAFVRAVILCLLAIFCLSLVAVPVKAEPPRGNPYYDLAEYNRADTDEDPWIEAHRTVRAPEGKGLSSLALLRCLFIKLDFSMTSVSRETNQSNASAPFTRKVSEYESDRLANPR